MTIYPCDSQNPDEFQNLPYQPPQVTDLGIWQANTLALSLPVGLEATVTYAPHPSGLNDVTW